MEIILCEPQNRMKCNKTLKRVTKHLSFLIDVGKFKCFQDVKSDMNGVFTNTLRICTWTVEIDDENEVCLMRKMKP